MKYKRFGGKMHIMWDLNDYQILSTSSSSTYTVHDLSS